MVNTIGQCRRARWLLIVLLVMAGSVVSSGSAAAQGDEPDDCTPVVLDILEGVDAVCDEIGRNQACYGHGLIDAEVLPGATIQFNDPGDFAELINLAALQTTPYDHETGDWGVALMAVQANLPDTMPGQNITFLLTGGVTLSEAIREPDANLMQAFYFTAGLGETRCQSAPDSLVIQSPEGVTVNLTVNGADIVLGSTAVLFAAPGERMDILMVGGGAEIASLDQSQHVPAGQQTSILLGGDDGLIAVKPPAEPVPYDPAAIQNIPLHLLPQTIEVPATTGWVNTGISLEDGQTFHIAASGMVNTHAVFGDEFQVWNSWWPPTGMAVDEACVAAEFDVTCRCVDQPDYEPCPVLNEPIIALAGRVGEGDSFAVSSGGDFVAPQAGELWLAVNDNRFDDNAGAFYAIVTVFED